MNQIQSAGYTKWLYLFIGVAVIINLSGLFIPIMGPDGTLYATIAKTMVQRNNYVELYAFGKDWQTSRISLSGLPLYLSTCLGLLPGPINSQPYCFYSVVHITPICSPKFYITNRLPCGQC